MPMSGRGSSRCVAGLLSRLCGGWGVGACGRGFGFRRGLEDIYTYTYTLLHPTTFVMLEHSSLEARIQI